MNISALFIKRPVATTLLMAALFIFGLMGFSRLAVNDMPNVEFPYIIVSATLPGADPNIMAVSVAKPLEKQLASVPGIKSMTTTNKQSSSIVFLEFEFDRDINDAALDVQAALSIAHASMPSSVTIPPLMFKLNPNSLPIFSLSLLSDTLTTKELTTYAETYVADRLSMVSGVAQTSVGGARRSAIRIQLEPQLMAARGISVEDISDAVNRANVTMPTGSLESDSRVRNISVNGQLSTAEDFANIIVAQRNGATIRLQDVATVIDGVESEKSASWINGKPGVLVQVVRQPDGNTVKVVEDIRKILPEIEAQLPASIKMEVMTDTSKFIEDSVSEVEFTLLLTAVLVILVIFVFLHDFRATIIPSLALPLAVIPTFAAMWIFGYSINNVSMLALILVVSFVVDDAIVMLENIVRHKDMGKTPQEAALDGSKEIGFTILSMTISLGAVFVPLLFLPGMMGMFFNEFGAVAVISIAFSGIVALTLTPMLCAKFLKEDLDFERGNGPISTFFENIFQALFNYYQKALMWCVKHKFVIFLASLGLIIATGYLATILKTGFMPDMDGGNVSITTEAEESIAFPAIMKAQAELHDIIAADPAVASFISTVGDANFLSNSNNGSISVQLKPISERDHINVVMERLRKNLSNSPTLNVYVANGDSMSGGSSKGAYEYRLTGSNQEELYEVVAAIEKSLKVVPGIIDLSTDVQLSNPQLRLEIDRDKAASLGISVLQIESALYSAFGQRNVSTIYTDLRDYKVIMEVNPSMQAEPSVLSSLYVRATTGKLVPIDTLVKVSYSAGPMAIYHQGQFPSSTIYFNIEAGASMSEVLGQAENEIAQHIPDGITGKYSGMAEQFQSSFSDMFMLICVSLLLIYLILGILYESFIHPITILAGLPSAAFGAFFALYIFGAQLDMIAMIGLIVLIGIVKKNAIMMIDFALEAERNDHSSPEDAIMKGCLVRFRPIMMTTFAAILGVMPLAIGIGETGADLRRPMGLCVVGGLAFSQLVTLFITPVYYIYLDRFGSFVKRLFLGKKKEVAA